MIKKLSLIGATLAMTTVAIAPAEAQYRGRYDDRGQYAREYRGNDSAYRYREQRRCSNGTTGAIIGAIAGGLLGRVIDRGGDRSVGTLLGAGGGALAGRAIERDGAKQAAYEGRCSR